MVVAVGLPAVPRDEPHVDASLETCGRQAARELIGEQLRAVARLAGVNAVLADSSDGLDPGWDIDDQGTVSVSPEYFLARGDSPREAAFAVLVELWAIVRETRRAPRVVARRRALAAADPTLSPLIDALVRAVAIWELVTALPGFRDLAELRAARVLAAAGPLPRHLAFAAELTRAAFETGPAKADSVDRSAARPEIQPEVRAELAALRDYSGSGDVIVRLLGPAANVGQSPDVTLDRQLAVFSPPYFRLRNLDIEELGVLGATSRPVGETEDEGPAPDELAPGHGGEDAQRADPEKEPAMDAPTVAPSPDPTADSDKNEQTSSSVASSPEDLFQQERAAFVSTVLDSPLAADDALIELLLEQAEDDGRTREDLDRDPASGRARDALLRQQTGVGLAAHERYAARVQTWADAIERTRDLWRRVIDERITVRRALGRRAHADGEVLSPWSLARAVVDTQAGMPSPAAFLRYEERSRVGHAPGSTDYAFVIDRSGSMQGRTAQAAADAVLVMLEALAGAARDIREAESRIDRDLDLELRTALFVYDAEPLCVKSLSSGLDDASRVRLDEEIRRVGGSTNDAAALDAVGAALEDHSRRRIAIVVSDGGTNDEAAARRALIRLRAAGVAVWGIGIGSDVVVARYAPLSRRVDHPDQLVRAIQDLIAELM